MLQGFYWDSYSDTKWTNLAAQADELAQYFNLVWIPQSAQAKGSPSMGYDPLYWFTNYNSSFGTEAELRSLISTFRSAGIGTIADVVINHRGNVSNWVDFPAEEYNGTTWQLFSTDICKNDDGGATREWADANGYALSDNNDTGEDWGGMRDLDHNSANVQANVKAYLSFLIEELGYTGFRYDMVKGYSGSFTGLYNAATAPLYSVGEYWDGNVSAVKSWLNATKVDGAVQSAAFDFPFRYTVRDAVNNGTWDFSAGGLVTDAAYQRYAVTFVENHDTEFRSSSSPQDPIKKDTLAANALLMTMPGTPCVFLKHWIDCKKDIKMMINARKMAGIENSSTTSKLTNANGYYVQKTTGAYSDLITAVGSSVNSYTPSPRMVEIVNGYHYRMFLLKTAERAWVDLPSGSYDNEQTATLTAISDTDGAQLVYTLDGSEPTPTSTTAASGTQITIPFGTTTLKVGLLVNGVVSAVITRNYVIQAFSPHPITVYVNTDQVGWNNVNFWSWGGDGSHAPSNTSWPGDKVTATTVIDGRNWYAKSFNINSSDDYVNFVFSTNSGSPQTVDIENVSQTTYFEISADTDGNGKHYVNDVTSTVTGIETISNDGANASQSDVVYSITGVRMPSGKQLPQGIYIRNGKKFVVR